MGGQRLPVADAGDGDALGPPAREWRVRALAHPRPMHPSVAERLSRLAPDQRTAATAPDGPVLCVAPAGSGKTTTLVARVAWLVDRGEDPRAITVVAFNKRAAEELAERLDAALEPLGASATHDGGVRVRTFHALGREVLAEAGVDVSVLADRDAVVRGLWPDMPAADRGRLDLAFSRLKLDLRVAVEDVAADEAAGPVARAWVAYEGALRDSGALDFDDLVLRALRLLEADAAARGQWRARCGQLLVDEAQDLDRTQLDLALLLAAPADRLFLVGDDDQTLSRSGRDRATVSGARRMESPAIPRQREAVQKPLVGVPAPHRRPLGEGLALAGVAAAEPSDEAPRDVALAVGERREQDIHPGDGLGGDVEPPVAGAGRQRPRVEVDPAAELGRDQVGRAEVVAPKLVGVRPDHEAHARDHIAREGHVADPPREGAVDERGMAAVPVVDDRPVEGAVLEPGDPRALEPQPRPVEAAVAVQRRAAPPTPMLPSVSLAPLKSQRSNVHPSAKNPEISRPEKSTSTAVPARNGRAWSRGRSARPRAAR